MIQKKEMRKNVKRNVLWLTETAVMLALLITVQMVTKPMGQIVTGTCVNAVLGITALVCGVVSGAIVALISPIAAFLLGIAPQVLTVPAIMIGNFVLVWVLGWRSKNTKQIWISMLRCVCAAVAKFAVLYILVVQVICHFAADYFLQSGTLMPPMVKVLSTTFAWPQLVTALFGSLIATWIAPLLRQVLHK